MTIGPPTGHPVDPEGGPHAAVDPAAPVDLGLLPGTATVDGGRLRVGGCDLDALAAEHGTPLFVYDETHIRDRCRAYIAEFGDAVAYAGKAFLCVAMARLVDEEGLHLDVATGGELHVALAAGFPPTRIIVHGNNKSVDELRSALAAGCSRIVVDSLTELERIEALVAEGLAPPDVLVRVTPGVEAHTHEYIETGTQDSKFGLSIASGAALDAACRAAASPAMRLAGLHCHIGSQVYVLDSYARAAHVMTSFAAEVEHATGAEIA
jgi:diaminopimelate decarboxylase